MKNIKTAKLLLIPLIIIFLQTNLTAQIFTENFETGMASFTNDVGNTTNFAISTSFFKSGSQCLRNPGAASTQTNIAYQTANMDLTNFIDATLTFWQIAKTEGTFDKCYIEVSQDAGVTWTILPNSTYTGASLDYATTTYFHEDSYALWGTTNVTPNNATWWQQETFNLTAYVGQNDIKIRFRTTPDVSTNRTLGGWMIDDILVTGTSTNDNTSQILISATLTEPSTISSLVNTVGTKINVFDFTLVDIGNPGDGLATIINQLTITQGATNTVADWSAVIAGARLDGPDATSAIGTISPTGITFSAAPLISLANGTGGAETYTLSIWLNTTVTDNSILDFKLANPSILVNAAGSNFGTYAVESGSETITVSATALAFVQQPTNVPQSATMSPSPTVEAIDANGNRDLDFITDIKLTESAGNMNSSPQTVTAVAGLATFSNLFFATITTGVTLTAQRSPTNDFNIISNPFNVTVNVCLITTLPYLQNFDTFATQTTPSCTNNNSPVDNITNCWYNDQVNDATEWTVNTATTPSTGTGPSVDHTGAGNYLYIEASGCSNKANLLSPIFDLTGFCSVDLSFYYHMFGSGTGTLQVDVFYNGTWHNSVPTNWNGNTAATTTGDQGDIWHLATTSLKPACGFPNVQLRFSGTTSGTFNDMALDDISLDVSAATSTIATGIGVEPLTISSLADTPAEKVFVYDFLYTDDGTCPATDANPSKITQIIINQGIGNDIADWTQAIAYAELSDGTTTIVGTVNATNITFAALTATLTGDFGFIDDNTNKTYSLNIYLKPILGGTLPTTIDGLNFVFQVNTTDITLNTTGGSSLTNSPKVSSASTENQVTVVSTSLAFVQQPTNTIVNALMSPNVTVSANDANGNRDLGFTGNIQITSIGVLTGTPISVAAVAGLATYTSIVHTVEQLNVTLTATNITPNPDWVTVSSLFDITPDYCGAADAPTDECAVAPAIDLSQPFNGSTNCAYTPSVGSPSVCGMTIENDSWLTFIAASSNVQLQYQIGDCTLNFGVQLAVFSGTCGVLTLIPSSCLNPTGELTTAIWNFTGLTVGASYYIRIDGYAGDLCNYAFTPISGVVIIPSNDNCANAIELTCGSTNIQSNILATNTDAPTACVGGGTTAKGVWYKFTGNGQTMTVSTDNPGTNFDTEINIYSGTCGALVCEGADDNGGTGTTSQFSFATVNGTQYYIYVDGNGTAEGQMETGITCLPGYWTGSVSNAWDNTGNWSDLHIPIAGDNATIPDVSAISNRFPIITVPAACLNLTIDAGANVQINPNFSLTVSNILTNSAGNAGLIVKSDATGTGSLIHNTANIDATVETYLSAAGPSKQWHMVSSPIVSAPSTLFTNIDFYAYDETTKDYWASATDYQGTMGWVATGVNLNPTQGYLYRDVASTISFTGKLNYNVAGYTIPATYTLHTGAQPGVGPYGAWINYDGWNLVGNPFPCALDWSTITKSDVNNTVYFYDNTTSNYKYFNASGATYNNGMSVNGGTQFIPAGQGFFIKTDDLITPGDGGSITIPLSARVHNTQNFWRNNDQTPIDEGFLRLSTQENNFTDELVIRTLPDATYNFDGQFDAYKRFSWNADVPQIYTQNNAKNTDFAINTIPKFSNIVSIPLGFSTNKQGMHKITLSENKYLNAKIYIEDVLLGTNKELIEGDSYEFDMSIQNNRNRFILHIVQNTTEISTLESNIEIFPNPSIGIFSINTNQEFNVTVTDISGKVIKAFYLKGNQIVNLSNQPKGIYFMKFANNKTVKIAKIIIQ